MSITNLYNLNYFCSPALLLHIFSVSVDKTY